MTNNVLCSYNTNTIKGFHISNYFRVRRGGNLVAKDFDAPFIPFMSIEVLPQENYIVYVKNYMMDLKSF